MNALGFVGEWIERYSNVQRPRMLVLVRRLLGIATDAEYACNRGLRIARTAVDSREQIEMHCEACSGCRRAFLQKASGAGVVK